jgi:hypothetical protein
MQSVTIAAAVPRSTGVELLRAISLTVLVLVVLMWSSAAATVSGGAAAGNSEEVTTTDLAPTVAKNNVADDGTETESVTMSIPLEEGGVIDIEAPALGLKIEKWDGDEVLVIVEKTKRARAGEKTTPVDPVNIQVTRRGKGVRIETTGGADWKSNGMDLSFRILLPAGQDIETVSNDTEDIAARVTAVLWRAFHRDALEWLTR